MALALTAGTAGSKLGLHVSCTEPAVGEFVHLRMHPSSAASWLKSKLETPVNDRTYFAQLRLPDCRSNVRMTLA